MRLFPLAAAAAALSLVGSAPAVEAKGCIKGALVGGAAGHYVGKGHALAGAAAGCLAGRHLAKRHRAHR